MRVLDVCALQVMCGTHPYTGPLHAMSRHGEFLQVGGWAARFARAWGGASRQAGTGARPPAHAEAHT